LVVGLVLAAGVSRRRAAGARVLSKKRLGIEGRRSSNLDFVVKAGRELS
jgi:hypothetical protein